MFVAIKSAQKPAPASSIGPMIDKCRVRDQVVETAHGGDGPVNGVLDLRVVPDVPEDIEASTSRRTNGCTDLGKRAVATPHDRDPDARLGEVPGRGRPDAGASTGDQCDPVHERGSRHSRSPGRVSMIMYVTALQ
jgi:hypothetical protein